MSLIPSLLSNRNIMDPFSTNIWAPSDSDSEVSAFVNARVDWKETPESHVFKADLPGLKKEEVKVEVEEEDKNEKWHRVERGRGKFQRKFWLPEDAKVDEVKASMENGVLTVIVPKVPDKKPEVKTIEISG